MHIDAPTVVFGLLCLSPLLYLWVWLPIKAVRMHGRMKRGLCVTCGRRYISQTSRPVDQMYSNSVDRLVCPKGHVYVSGNRHFAEW